ncbi:MAG: hypothetical protein WD557_01950 [Dehalococcoidia bacterium]
MEYFRSTGTSGGLLFTRTTSAFVKERCSELLRLVSEADRAIVEGSPDAAMRFSLVRDLVLAAVGPAWVRENEGEPSVVALRSVLMGVVATPEGAAAFDHLCSSVLRARFPVETERPPAERNSRWGPHALAPSPRARGEGE